MSAYRHAVPNRTRVATARPASRVGFMQGLMLALAVGFALAIVLGFVH